MLYMANIKITVNNCTWARNIAKVFVEEDKQARWGTNRSMKIIVHWTKIPTSSSRSRREWKFIKEAYMTKRYIKRYILSLRKRETKKSIKKIYLCTYLWIKKFPCESATSVNWVNQSFQIIRTRTFVSIGTATSILRASQIFFFLFSRDISNSNWFSFCGDGFDTWEGSRRFSTRIFTTRPRNLR